jgi:chitinase
MVSLTFILTLYIPSLAGVYAQTYLAGTDVAISGNISSSTEHALGLGTKPLVPIDPKTSEDPWTTSLVNGCPKLCSDVGFRVDNWTQIHDSKKLASCNETILFTFNMENAPDRFTSFSTCTVKESSTVDKRHDTIDTVATRNHARRHLMGKRSHANRHVLKRQDDNNITTISDVKVLQKNIASSDSCGAHKSSVKATASFGPAGVIKSTGDISTAFEALLSFFKHGARCGSNVMFAKHGNATLGAYAGADLPYTSAFDVLHNHR